MPTPHESQDGVCSGQTRNQELSHKNKTCWISARYKTVSQDCTSIGHPEQGNLGTGLTPGCQGGKGAEEAVITDRYRAFFFFFFLELKQVF